MANKWEYDVNSGWWQTNNDEMIVDDKMLEMAKNQLAPIVKNS